jgi:hypothetical protein
MKTDLRGHSHENAKVNLLLFFIKHDAMKMYEEYRYKSTH